MKSPLPALVVVTRRGLRPACGFLASMLLFAARPVAAAGPSSDAAAAQVLFDQSRVLIEQGRYSDACPKLEESQRLDAAWGTLINLADCYEHVGRTASAWSRFIQVASGSRQAGQAARAEAAKARAAALEERLSKLLISVSEADRPAGLEVKRDGVAVGAAQWDTDVPVDPGEHVIEAAAPGRRRWKTTVVVGAVADRKRVLVPVLDKERAPVVEVAAIAPTPENATGWSGTRMAGAVIGGIGVAALGTAAYFTLSALHYKNEAGCHQTDCPTPQASNELSTAHTMGDFATGFAVGGGVGVALGATLFLVGGSSSQRTTSVRIGPSARGNGIAVAGTF